jgi:hypothetical protein
LWKKRAGLAMRLPHGSTTDVEALGKYYQSQQTKENRVVVRGTAKKEKLTDREG